MTRQDVLVGSLIVAVCVLFAAKERVFLEKTNKGQRLIRWFGPDRAVWVFRGLALCGIAFGVLLAMGIVRPIQW